MLRLGGAAILMQQTSMKFEIGSWELLKKMREVPVWMSFSRECVEFLDIVSGILMADTAAKAFPDIITFAFWIRRANMERFKNRYTQTMGNTRRLGRGVVFHIAPSNVAVNYAYSLAAGLLLGNANIVRLPGKDFPQIRIINDAFGHALEDCPAMQPYLALVRYGHEREINDYLSALADVRVVWGGNQTIAQIRKSPLGARASEVTFADRFSLAVMDADTYLGLSDKEKEQTAFGFYQDTYLTDQNACTSPRLVVWHGSSVEEAKEEFWARLHRLGADYPLSGIQAVDKLAGSYAVAAALEGTVIEPAADNRLTRVRVSKLSRGLLDYKVHSGFFLEYTCKDVMEMAGLCDDRSVQTVAYVGESAYFEKLITSGIHGIDRIVPIGHTMDFDLLWDGYDLAERLSRQVMM